MDFGVSYFPTDESIEPAEMAQLCEQRGFESMFVTDHTHIPASRETPWPAGAELPREYARTHDPFVALATAAQATETIKLGTAICLLVERDPIVTAKQAAGIDALSGGRFLFGVGAGWNREEMANHGTDPDRRFGLLRERVEAVRAIWTEDEASYHGKYVDFENIWCWPKPVQPGGPPVLLGGNGPKVLDRVLRYADAWFPNRIGDEEHNIPRMEELQRRASDEGRDPIPVTLQIPPRDPDSLRRYEAAGVTRTVHMMRPTDAADTASAEAKLDGWAERAAAYRAG